MTNSIQLTQETEMFKKINAPHFKYVRISLAKVFVPTNLQMNKTYYMFKDNVLKAFKVVAYAIDDREMDNIKLSYLVQYPNNAIEWQYDFLTQKANIYESKEAFLCSGGSRVVDLCWENLERVINTTFQFKVFECIDGVITNPKRNNAGINYMVYNGHNWIASVSGRYGHKVYLSYDECLKQSYNGLQCEDFAENVAQINIEVTISKPSISTIQIVEL